MEGKTAIFSPRLPFWLRKLPPEQVAIQTSADKVQLMAEYHLVTRAWDAAQIAVEGAIGASICMSGCGRCCAVTTVLAMDIESAFAISWLLGQPSEVCEPLVERCKGWLVDRTPGLTLYGGEIQNPARLHQEVQHLLFQSPCPFLTDSKACAIHEARPLTCRAYGVTRQAGSICPRPPGVNEGSGFRAHIGDQSEAGRVMRAMVQRLLRNSASQGLLHCRFLATAIVMSMAPDFFNAQVDDGRVATAKLAELPFTPSILFQDQLEQVVRAEQLERLVAIPKEGI